MDCESTEIEIYSDGTAECIVCGWVGHCSHDRPHTKGEGGRARYMEDAASLIREVLEAMYANPSLRQFWKDERIIVARAVEKWMRENAHARFMS